MTTEQIEIRNNVIAEFMGLKKEPPNEIYNLPQWYRLGKKKEFVGYDSDLQYHSSWDWIIPVVTKLKSTIKPVVKSGRIDNRGIRLLKSIKEIILTGDIEKVFEYVVACIVWYNSTNKS